MQPFLLFSSDEKTGAEDFFKEGLKYYQKKEYKKAAPFIKKAAESGHSDAQMHLGKMYFNGWGIRHDHEEAKRWHEKAADQGNKESIEKLKKFKH